MEELSAIINFNDSFNTEIKINAELKTITISVKDLTTDKTYAADALLEEVR